jgi:serine protease Do
MHVKLRGTAAAVLAASFWVGAGAEARQPQEPGHSRESPVVAAVKKAADSIVTIKVEKHGVFSKREVTGTGVIVDARGYVVTNCHVVNGSESIKVLLPDGSDVTAELFTQDAAHDIAVVKLPADHTYQELRFGPASDLMVGEDVIAIGHPFGYRNTVSTGIISALDRDVPMPEGEVLTNLIQTSASINPGNSGGPLLNINGELIGINVAVRQEAHGIAFALNADMVQHVLSQALSAGKIAHVSHGLICHEVVKAEDGDDRVQVVVDEVAAKSPAAEAGLKKGDVLTRVGDLKVTNRFDVERALWSCKAGDDVKVALTRGGRETNATLALVKGDGERTTASADPVVEWDIRAVGTPVNDQK